MRVRPPRRRKLIGRALGPATGFRFRDSPPDIRNLAVRRSEQMSDPRSMEKSLMTQPEAMAGGGQYNEHSTAQLTAAARALPLLRQAAAVVPPTSDGSLTIADYGC